MPKLMRSYQQRQKLRARNMARSQEGAPEPPKARVPGTRTPEQTAAMLEQATEAAATTEPTAELQKAPKPTLQARPSPKKTEQAKKMERKSPFANKSKPKPTVKGKK